MKRLRIALSIALLALVAGAVPAAASGERFSGVIAVEHADHFDAGYSVDDVRLRTEDGTLEVADRGLSRFAGQQVTLTATRRGDVLTGASVVSEGDGSADGSRAGWPFAPPRAGARRLAVLLASTPTDTARRWKPDETRELLFGGGNSVASYFRDASGGRTSLSGEVFGWYSGVYERCERHLIMEQAVAAARADGVRLEDFHHVMVVFPRLADCGWNGLAYIQGPQSWINGQQRDIRVMAHELGHNIGVAHAGAEHCTRGNTPVAISETCTSDEYGDPLDVMGRSPSNLFHAARRATLGWLPAGHTRVAEENGIYELQSVNAPGDGLKQLLIKRPGPGFYSNDAPDYFSLELRTATGAFDPFAPEDTAVNGVGVRLTFGEKYGGGFSRLLDMTPGTPGGHRDGQLRPGGRFTDSRPGVTFAVESISGGVARVRVGTAPPAVPGEPAEARAPGRPVEPSPQPPPAIAFDRAPGAARDTVRPALRLSPSVPRRGRTLARSRRLTVSAADAGGGLRIEVRLDGRVVASGAGGRLVVRLPARARRGRHALELAATDAAGNRESVRIQIARGVLRPAR